jgi:hypothetical protein
MDASIDPPDADAPGGIHHLQLGIALKKPMVGVTMAQTAALLYGGFVILFGLFHDKLFQTHRKFTPLSRKNGSERELKKLNKRYHILKEMSICTSYSKLYKK